MCGYLLVAALLNYKNHKSFEHPAKQFVAQVFDAGTFALSLALFAKVFDAKVLELIGSLKLFLIICGIAGVAYAIRALFK